MNDPDPTNPPATPPPSTGPGENPEVSPRAVGYRTPIWLWIVTLGVLGAVAWMQRPEPPDPARRVAAVQGKSIDPPGPDAAVIMTKIILAMRATSPGSEPLFQGMADQFAGWAPANPFVGTGGVSVTNPPVKRQEPYPAVDRFRTAVLAGETLGAEEIGWRLDDVEKDLAPDSELRQDVDTVRKLYGVGDKPKAAEGEDAGDDSDAARHPAVTPVKPEEIDPAALEGFKKRHTFFADLALTRGDEQSAFRQKASMQGMLMLTVMFLAMMGAMLVGLAGCVLLVIALVNLPKLKARFVRPNPDTEFPAGEAEANGQIGGRGAGSVWLETACVFIASFLAIKGIMLLVQKGVGSSAPWMIYLAFGLQALSAVTIFWPLVRGMSFARWKRESGWAAPRGVLREIGAGIVGYIAMVPLYFAMAIVVVLLMLVTSRFTGAEPPVPEGNRITEIVESGSVLVMLALFLMATVWAPTVEESIFRGALFRHLRRRVALPAAALGSAVVFAVLHGYVLQGLLMVGTLGFMFAILREWRGSLVACVTAHAIHNGIVMTLIGTVMTLAAP